MDAKRLEELVYRCNEASEDISNGFGAYFDSHDIADLARCAKAWAKVERARAICDVSGRIIDSAKVEVEMVRAIGASEPASKRFFSFPEESRELPARVVGRIEGK